MKKGMEMRKRLGTTAVFMSFFLVLSAFIAVYTARCDPYSPPLTGVEVEGAHIVSEGAYFRFWIFNNNSFPIQVQMRDKVSV